MNIAVENGTFAYRSGETLLRDVSFAASGGDVLAILGPNGAGKTTLLRAMLGLLQWQSGQTLLDGTDTRRISPRTLWQRVAYVPQARSAVTDTTVEEMVLLGRSSRIGAFSSPTETDMEKTHAAIHRLHLEHLSGRRCSELSGGELQMVLIARAICTEPGVLVLDEPESNLDFRNQLLVLNTIGELAAEGLCCIFNTHYPAHALRMANRALMLGHGGGYIFGDTEQIVTSENISAFFGVRAYIGKISTPQGAFRDVIPLSTEPVSDTPAPL